jgi:hypothetical protein
MDKVDIFGTGRITLEYDSNSKRNGLKIVKKKTFLERIELLCYKLKLKKLALYVFKKRWKIT